MRLVQLPARTCACGERIDARMPADATMCYDCRERQLEDAGVGPDLRRFWAARERQTRCKREREDGEWPTSDTR